MRAVFIGANSLTVMTARVLLNRGVEVVIIERDKELIDGLTGELDAGFVHGDGSKPAILRETDPQHTDFLFCLTAVTRPTSSPVWWAAPWASRGW